jgi:hypothetical protein
MKHRLISFCTKSGAIALSSVSFLLLLDIVVGSQLASIDNTNGNSNFAHVFSAYAQPLVSDLNGTLMTNEESIAIDNDTSQNTYVFKEVRGDVGGMIIDSADAAVNQTAQSGVGDYVVTGTWRLVANQSILERFVANLTIARTDGMEFHNILIEDVGPYVELRDNGSTMTSEFMATIYRNNFNFTTVTAPVQLEIRGDKVIQIAAHLGDISPPASLEILHLLDEKPLYGTIQTVALEDK